MNQTTTPPSKNQFATLAFAAVVSACQLVTDFARQSFASTIPFRKLPPSTAKSAKPSHLLHRLQFVARCTVQSQWLEVNKIPFARSLALDSVNELFGDCLTSILEELSPRFAA